MKRTIGHHLLFPFRLRNSVSSLLFRYLFGHRFAAFGAGTNAVRLDGVEGAENISIGAGTVIGAHSYLAARPINIGEAVSLSIGDGARIGRNNHIYSTRHIDIGPRVLTASNVYIADNSHSYEDPDIAIFDQPLLQLNPVSIGSGTWIGHSAAVIGAQVGRNCVIGSNALVRDDVPDHCVVVGAPARIVKRYDPELGTWRVTGADGSFRGLDP